MNNYSQKGFTLIELLVVIAIVGILAGVIIVSMTSATDNATIAKAKVFSNSMRDSMGNSIVSEWKFDGSGVADGSAATTSYTRDTWGNNNGTINGGPIVASGNNCIYGSCLSFTGTNYVEITNLDSFANLSSFSLEFWIKTSTSNKDIINKAAATNDQRSLGLVTNTSGYITFYLSPNGTQWYSKTGAINVANGKWNHVVAFFDSSKSKIFLYVNGKADGDGVAYNYTNVYNSTATFRIGASYFLAQYIGYLDEIRFYNSALPSSKIKNDYLAGLNNLLAKKEIDEQEYQQRLLGFDNFCFVNK
jgi:prepilin-type N-terminal cleavage/methylation domain-containing protein